MTTAPENDPIRPILLVDDRAVDIDLTRRAFAKRKLLNPIEVARDGEEAIAYFDRWEAGEPLPICILLDLRMPKMNGLEVLRRLKSHPRFASIPVIMLTTSKEDSDVEEAYKLGCNSYIIKPVEFEKFIEVASNIEVYWCALNTPAGKT
jgi:CheY-like chemotaxis protein